MKNINRGEFNSLNNLRKDKSTANKPGKLKSIGRLLVNKIDDILGQYKTSSTSANSYSDVYSASKNMIANINENLNYVDTDPKTENSSKNVYQHEIEPKDKIKQKDKKKKLNKIPKKDTFMTYVDIEEAKAEENQKPSRYVEEQDKKIKETMEEIDNIDNFLNDEEEREYLKENPEHYEDVKYFKDLINEVDSYKKNIKEEFDELQYLIKFVDATKGRINRHKFGVSNMFTQTGLKTLKRPGESDEENSDGEPYYTKEGIYDKTKNLSKIKDKLFNMQGNVLNFYQNFNSSMKQVERNNKDYTTTNKELKEKLVRATTSDAKIRAKSKPK